MVKAASLAIKTDQTVLVPSQAAAGMLFYSVESFVGYRVITLKGGCLVLLFKANFALSWPYITLNMNIRGYYIVYCLQIAVDRIYSVKKYLFIAKLLPKI